MFPTQKDGLFLGKKTLLVSAGLGVVLSAVPLSAQAHAHTAQKSTLCTNADVSSRTLAGATPANPVTISSQELVALNSLGRDEKNVHITDKLREAAYTIGKPTEQLQNWTAQATRIGKTRHPPVVVVHLHTLRPNNAGTDDTRDYPNWEEELILGLGFLANASPTTRYVIWSRRFEDEKLNKQPGKVYFKKIVADLSNQYPGMKKCFERVSAQSFLLYWPDQPNFKNDGDLQYVLTQAIPNYTPPPPPPPAHVSENSSAASSSSIPPPPPPPPGWIDRFLKFLGDYAAGLAVMGAVLTYCIDLYLKSRKKAGKGKKKDDKGVPDETEQHEQKNKDDPQIGVLTKPAVPPGPEAGDQGNANPGPSAERKQAPDTPENGV